KLIGYLLYITVSCTMVNVQCVLPLPVGSSGICVPKDCKSLCHKKHKGGGRCTPEEKNECLCLVCRG
ncbi:hypothetical protein CARUB_v10015401mg, partial [Capsella rubella]